jgi:hypothetical protein
MSVKFNVFILQYDKILVLLCKSVPSARSNLKCIIRTLCRKPIYRIAQCYIPEGVVLILQFKTITIELPLFSKCIGALSRTVWSLTLWICIQTLQRFNISRIAANPAWDYSYFSPVSWRLCQWINIRHVCPSQSIISLLFMIKFPFFCLCIATELERAFFVTCETFYYVGLAEERSVRSDYSLVVT